MKKAFVSMASLDSVEIICPCGASIVGEGDRIAEFKRQHRAHTDGTCDHSITADGMRACVQKDL